MKKSIQLLIVCLALSNCSTSIESKSNKLALDTAAQQEARLTRFIEQGYRNVDNFIQNQTIIRGELSTRLRGRVTDIVPQLSERVKFGNLSYPMVDKVRQAHWTYGIELTSPRMSQKSYQRYLFYY